MVVIFFSVASVLCLIWHLYAPQLTVLQPRLSIVHDATRLWPSIMSNHGQFAWLRPCLAASLVFNVYTSGLVISSSHFIHWHMFWLFVLLKLSRYTASGPDRPIYLQLSRPPLEVSFLGHLVTLPHPLGKVCVDSHHNNALRLAVSSDGHDELHHVLCESLSHIPQVCVGVVVCY